MDINQVKKSQNERKIIKMTIRTHPAISKWMKKNRISPQLVFDHAIHELIEQENKKRPDNELIKAGKRLNAMSNSITEGLVGRGRK